jgi:anti-anti-sigma regulatory factor
MSEISLAAGLVRGVPVVTAPVVVDGASARAIQVWLQRWALRGHATLVVDMTRTLRCEASGADVLQRAHRRALDEGGELRLVAPPGAEWRAVQGARPGRPMRCFPTIDAAVAELPAMAIAPDRHARPAGPAAKAGLTGPGPAPARYLAQVTGRSG